MDRRNFISNSSKFLVSAVLTNYIPELSYSSDSSIPAILARFLPLVRKFIKRMLVEGVEEYTTDRLVEWLEKVIGPNKKMKEEVSTFEQSTNTTLNFYSDVNVYNGVNKRGKTFISLFPVLEEGKEGKLNKLLTDHSFVPVFYRDKYMDYLNFPEVIGINEIIEHCFQNYNEDKYFNRTIRESFLPIKVETRHSLQIENNQIGTCIYYSKKGLIYIIYEVNEKVEINGEVSFKPIVASSIIKAEKKGFYFQLKKKKKY